MQSTLGAGAAQADALEGSGGGMNRRSFITNGLFSLYPCTCSFNSARAAAASQGCRMAAAGSDPLKENIRQTSGDGLIDAVCGDLHKALVIDFSLRPGFGFFNDGIEPNALATPRVLLPDGPNGTVLLGLALLDHEIRAAGNRAMAIARIAVIHAHEFGHILQYSTGMTTDGPWQMEPHADFIAGWALGKQASRPAEAGRLPSPISLFLPIFGNADAVQTIFDKGDTLFHAREHHGQPEFRAAVVQAGYDARGLDAMAAFDKGKAMSGLSRSLTRSPAGGAQPPK